MSAVGQNLQAYWLGTCDLKTLFFSRSRRNSTLSLFVAGEEGRLAYEQLDTLPGEMIRLGTWRGNAVTTAFWAIVPHKEIQQITSQPSFCPLPTPTALQRTANTDHIIDPTNHKRWARRSSLAFPLPVFWARHVEFNFWISQDTEKPLKKNVQAKTQASHLQITSHWADTAHIYCISLPHLSPSWSHVENNCSLLTHLCYVSWRLLSICT